MIRHYAIDTSVLVRLLAATPQARLALRRLPAFPQERFVRPVTQLAGSDVSMGTSPATAPRGRSLPAG